MVEVRGRGRPSHRWCSGKTRACETHAIVFASSISELQTLISFCCFLKCSCIANVFLVLLSNKAYLYAPQCDNKQLQTSEYIQQQLSTAPPARFQLFVTEKRSFLKCSVVQNNKKNTLVHLHTPNNSKRKLEFEQQKMNHLHMQMHALYHYATDPTGRAVRAFLS